MVKSAPSGTKKPRVRELPKHRSFRLSKPHVFVGRDVATARALIRQTNSLIGSRKRLFAGLAAIYAVINFVMIQGLGAAFTLVDTKTELQDIAGGNLSQLKSAFVLLGTLGQTDATVNEAATLYQFVLYVITTLAVIWAVRQVSAGMRISLRDTYYKGMYPLIPFLLVLLVIGLQLVPAVIANFLVSTVVVGGLATTGLEVFLWLALAGLLWTLSIYLVLSSLIALYIVTLPDVQPMQALRSARELVLHRRVKITARLIVLAITLGIAVAIMFLPLIIVSPAVVEPFFLVTSGALLIYVNAWMYGLYRDLLQ